MRPAFYFTESAGTILMLSTLHVRRLLPADRSAPVFVVADFVQHILAFNQFAEGRVLTIETRRRRGR